MLKRHHHKIQCCSLSTTTTLSLLHEHDAHFYGYYTATVRQYLLCGPSLDRKYGLLPPRMMLIVCISNAVLSCSIYITCTVTTCNSHEALQSMPTCSPFNGHATFRFATKHFHTNFDSIDGMYVATVVACYMYILSPLTEKIVPFTPTNCSFCTTEICPISASTIQCISDPSSFVGLRRKGAISR